MGDGLTILYDGQCPFCSSYVAMMRLRRSVGEVELVDARSGDPRVAAALSQGLDLDRGMVVQWQGQQFHGADAVHLLATLSAEDGGMNRLQRRIFASPRRAAALYPLMAAGRRLYLRLAGRPRIGAGEKNPRDLE